MKKIFYLLILMSISNVNAQNFEYLKKIQSLDFDEAKEITQYIISEMRKEYRIFDYKEIDSSLVFLVLDKDIDNETFKKNSSKYDDNYFYVAFQIFYEGENIPLEIEGKKKYFLSFVEYNYLDLFPYWKKYFNNDADLEGTINNFEMGVSNNSDNEGFYCIFTFRPYDGKKWEIRNMKL